VERLREQMPDLEAIAAVVDRNVAEVERLRAALEEIVEGIDNGATLDEVHRHARRALEQELRG
jgi:hypothetical protein